eukprot:CAMPEP_0178973978 /NCGR_PEP_ID=MMETSP0789-20121207/22117_1 /TAXON_ID=3005 /ORGANISM="Rhizosolenia setigera, Strain CCMP 1694" /LENGTH=321 /DNA_ID=CAMNT_0020662093 /DNA_START=87 /DNA_END=1053 /DNA_ORIENTATION=-
MIFYSRVLLLAAILSLVASDPVGRLLNNFLRKEGCCEEKEDEGSKPDVPPGYPYKQAKHARVGATSVTCLGKGVCDCKDQCGTGVCSCAAARAETCCDGPGFAYCPSAANNATCDCIDDCKEESSDICSCSLAKVKECCGPDPVQCLGKEDLGKCDCKNQCGTDVCSCAAARAETCCDGPPSVQCLVLNETKTCDCIADCVSGTDACSCSEAKAKECCDIPDPVTCLGKGVCDCKDQCGTTVCSCAAAIAAIAVMALHLFSVKTKKKNVIVLTIVTLMPAPANLQERQIAVVPLKLLNLLQVLVNNYSLCSAEDEYCQQEG